MAKLTEAKKEANKKWNQKNKERMNYLAARSQAKRFVNKFATLEDLDNLEKIIAEKRKELEHQNCFLTARVLQLYQTNVWVVYNERRI